MLLQAYLSARIGADGLGLVQLVLSVCAFSMTLGLAGARVAATCLCAQAHGRRSRAEVQSAAERREEFAGAFDVVIADVPCSGLGVIRKKPDIRYKNPDELARLPALQSAILENVCAYVRAGGVLLYSTCTVLRRENQDVVQAFLARHPEFRPEAFAVPPDAGLENDGMLTLLPCVHGTDGFFICKLRKQP